MNVTHRVRVVGMAVLLALTATLFAASPAAAAEPDNSCGTRPSSVPAGWSCRTLHELAPSNNTATPYGEVWYFVNSSNELLIKIFPSLTLSGTDPVQVCVNSVGFVPRQNGKPFRCVGSEPSRVYVGSGLDLTIDLTDAGIAAGAGFYFQVHVNQGGRSTFTDGTDEVAGYTNPSNSAPSTSATEICSGQTVTYEATGFKANTSVRISRSYLEGETGKTDVLENLKANSSGSVSTSVRLPEVRVYEIVASGAGPNKVGRETSRHVKAKDCTINPSAAASSSPLEAVTETTASPGAWLIALALLMMLVPPIRRRRRRSA